MTIRSGVLLLVLWVSAHADTLILHNGTRVTGRWWATDADLISFLVNDHLERYSRSEVSEVVFGNAPSSAASMVTAPDRIGAIYFQDDTGNLLPLERTQGVAHRAAAAGAPRSIDSGQYWDVPGQRSPFRLKSGFKMLFVVEMPYGTEPGTFSLYPLETKGNTRQAKLGGGNGSTMTIPFTTRKVAGDTYVLVPVEALGPGEYSFSLANSNDAYCFGIDPVAAAARYYLSSYRRHGSKYDTAAVRYGITLCQM